MKEQSPDTDDSGAASRRRPRRRWRWCLLLGLLAIFLHAQVLRGIGRGLMAEAPSGDSDVAVVFSGDHRLQAALELIASGRAEKIWLIEGRPRFVVAAGILPSEVEVLRNRLIEMGAGAHQVEILSDPEVDDLPDAVRLLRKRLSEQPDLQLVVLCGGLGGRHLRLVLDEVLGPDAGRRVAVLGLPYDRFDVDAWWRSRSGLKHLFSEFCALGFTLAVGTGPQPPPPAVDPAAIEARLRQRFGETACDVH